MIRALRQVLRFSPSAKIQAIIPEQIEGHVSALKSLVKSQYRRNKGDPVRLDFELEDTEVQGNNIVKGKEVSDEDLRKPFKEARRTPPTRRIIEFAGPEYKMPNNIKLYDGTIDPEDHSSRFASAANSGEWPMPVWCRMFQQSLDGSAKGWFERLPPDSINEWADLREAFAARFSVRRACFKEPHEITKIIKSMKISSFMNSVKSPELAKHFLNKVPTTVNEMMERLDDFVQSEEAYASTKLPKGKTGESHIKTSFPSNGRDVWPLQNTRPMESRRDDYQNRHRGRDIYRANRPMDERASYPPARGQYNRRVTTVLALGSLTKRPKEILATETQLRLSIPRPMLNPWDQETLIEPMIVEAEVEGYLIRRVYVDKGSEAWFKDPLGHSLHIHAMMKFPTPKAVATLVTRTLIIVECKRLEKKQMVEVSPEEKGEVAVTEEVLVNSSFLDQY
uniref:Reverse transcriptase domain-containing protein n=1 Tax=Tanacetum cinerariifolium TaxID=118510 RepID=A0A699KBE6_TANCI|nr:reverse transcriptase domain-containing protein [Tanacetum cinerariifolium]